MTTQHLFANHLSNYAQPVKAMEAQPAAKAKTQPATASETMPAKDGGATPTMTDGFASAEARDAHFDAKIATVDANAEAETIALTSRCGEDGADKNACRAELVQIGQDRAGAIDAIESERAAAVVTKTS
ncbi:MAG: hypothetical protein ACKVH0_18570 [Alphaproteobacteria bacterium]|jgi:hypothetical protein